MKITDIEILTIEVNHRGDWIFVMVHTDGGITGLGEASHSSNDALLIDTIWEIKKRLIGTDPLDINATWNLLAKWGGGRITATALSAIEQALWDITGQYVDLPIHALFGGKIRKAIRLYANINRHVRDRSPAGFAKAALSAVNDGFTAVKLAPFDEINEPNHIRTGPHSAWKSGVDRVAAVRDTVGSSIDLAVDCHGRFDPTEALVVARELEPYDLLWLEEPVPHRSPAELHEISRSILMPTASAESVFSVEGFAPFLLRRTVDVLMPDVKHCGGIREMRAIGDAARMHRLLIAPHNPSGPVASAASAQIISTMTNFLILEYAWGEVSWRKELLDPPEAIENGILTVPTGSGLGHTINFNVAEAHRKKA
ncbi:MAG: hypothetical protein CMN78_00950 [Spirochaetales bacterium]|nr:hypothetical protein [Spirochaetales bacterium]